MEEELEQERALRMAVEGRAWKAEVDADAERSKTKVIEDRLADLEKDREKESADLQTQMAAGVRAQDQGEIAEQEQERHTLSAEEAASSAEGLHAKTTFRSGMYRSDEEVAHDLNATGLEIEITAQRGHCARHDLEIVSFNSSAKSATSMEIDEDCGQDSCRGSVSNCS